MPDNPNPAPDEDPWLTVPQVSEELKLHPATVRVWVNSGRLAAVRAGRTWRVRRSEVDRALLSDASPAYLRQETSPRLERRLRPSLRGRRPREASPTTSWPSAPGPGEQSSAVTPAMTGDPRVALEQVQLADQRWGDALEASVEAPPDEGFAQRVRAIANAAEQEAAALRHADMLGLAHRPHPGARNMQLSHELRPGARSRRGPVELWERFDAAVAELGEALEGVALSAIARAFGELSDVARELAAEIERLDSPRSCPSPRRLTSRGRAAADAPVVAAAHESHGALGLNSLRDAWPSHECRPRGLRGSGASSAQSGSPPFSQFGLASSSKRARSAALSPCCGPKCSSHPTTESPPTSQAPTQSPCSSARCQIRGSVGVNGWQIAGRTCPA